MLVSTNRGVRTVGAVLGALALLAAGEVRATEGSDRIAEVFAARVSLQKQLAGWMEETLRELAAPSRLLVTVRLQMRGEIRDLVKREGAPGSELKIGSHKAMKLPGLPMVDKPLSGVAAPDISVKMPGNQKVEVQRQLESRVEHIAVRLYVEKGIPASQLERVKAVASDLAGLEPTRGDVLDVIEFVAQAERAVGQQASQPGVTRALLVVCGTVLLSCLFLAIAIARRGGRGPAQALTIEKEKQEEAARVLVPGGADVVAAPGAQAIGAEDGGGHRSFAFLAGASADDVLEILGEVEPSVGAAVLDKVHLDGAVVRQIFEALPKDRQLAIAMSLGRSRIMPRAVVDQAEELVRTALERARSRVRVGGASRLADILADAPESAQRELLEQVAQGDPGLAEAIRAKMLLFEELASFPPESLRQVVTGVEPATLALALVGASPAVNEAVMSAVSKRLRGILEAELDTMKEPHPHQVESARKTVERVMRRFQSQGEVRTRAEAAA